VPKRGFGTRSRNMPEGKTVFSLRHYIGRSELKRRKTC